MENKTQGVRKKKKVLTGENYRGEGQSKQKQRRERLHPLEGTARGKKKRGKKLESK